MAAIFKNGRQMLLHHMTSGRQGDSGRWARRLFSTPRLPPPRCIAGSVPGSWSIYMYFFNAKLVAIFDSPFCSNNCLKWLCLYIFLQFVKSFNSTYVGMLVSRSEIFLH